MYTVGDDNSQGPCFGFLDPNAVICMVHLISVYDMGHTRKLLQMPSIADQSHDHEEGEFKVYYVGMFSDCDLFMWYSGGGIGVAFQQHLTWPTQTSQEHTTTHAQMWWPVMFDWTYRLDLSE
ncbi:hypothetical protein EI94DRAFT_1701063 [Lactarius quietus]|nr:hypothetical protein EI94DRAFT_1701063 [Lactarius quietus]